MFWESGPVFMGEFEVAVDEKNRVSIPSKWKTLLDEQIVLNDGFEGAIEIRSKAEFQKYYEKIKRSNEYLRETRILKRKILGSAHELTLDKWKRFVIPPSLMSDDFKKGVLLRGNGDSIEIWGVERYKEWSTQEKNDLEEAARVVTEKQDSEERKR